MELHTGAAVPPIRKKRRKKKISVFMLFFIELNNKFASFSSFTFYLQIFGKLELQAKTVSAAL